MLIGLCVGIIMALWGIVGIGRFVDVDAKGEEPTFLGYVVLGPFIWIMIIATLCCGVWDIIREKLLIK